MKDAISGMPHARPGRQMALTLRKIRTIPVAALCTLVLLACSPRDYLTRRLASDLIAASSVFRAPQQFVLQTGVLSNKDYSSPEYLILQHHGWISGTAAPCPPGLAPPPCWDVLLTPNGVDTIRALVPAEAATRSSLPFPAAKRELVSITGVSKDGALADVEFTWKWVPLNEVGAALYSGDLRYTSTVGFRHFDDGWRILQSSHRSGQSLDEALRNAEPIP